MARVKRRQYKLVFQDEALAGVEITVRSLTSGQLIELQESGASHEKLTKMLAEQLVSWNVEDEDGTPVPATLDGIRSLDLGFNKTVIDVWTDAVMGVKAPLPQSSNGGHPSVEQSIPMDALSESLAS